MICASPLNRLRDQAATAGVPDDPGAHAGIQATLAGHIVDSNGDEVVTGMEQLLDFENRLGLPVMGFADELAVHKIPALVVAAAKGKLHAGSIQVPFLEREVRPIDRRRVGCLDRLFAPARPGVEVVPGGVIKFTRVFRNYIAVLGNRGKLPPPILNGYNVLEGCLTRTYPAHGNLDHRCRRKQ